MASLKLSFLGHPIVSVNGEAIQLRPKKVLALLAYLGVSLERHTRDALAELLYSRQERDRARAGVRQSLSILRGLLGEDWIRADGDAVWLDVRKGLWIDIHEVRRLRGRLTAADLAGDQAKTRETLGQLERLFRGDFLSGFFLKDTIGFESWQTSVEESLRNERTGILEKLTALHLSAHENDEAIDCARRWLMVNPADEAGHRALMKSYALSGKRTEALRQYERCRLILQTEISATPELETEKLYAQIARGELPPADRSGRPSTDLRSPPGNLRTSPTAFIGREPEVKAVITALLRPDLRLLTITGPAGAGKTRLALEAAVQVMAEFPHGVFFVDLAVLREPAHVLPTVASVLGVRDAKGTSSPPFDLVRGFLRNRRLLLILDNFEHLLDASDTVARLIGECPLLTILATSREALRVQAENEFLLSPLRLPSRGDPVEDLHANEAVRLFTERARASRHGFVLSNEIAGAVVRICIRLDGLPLAIELAAARARFLPPGKLLSLLEMQGSSLLRGGSKDMPVRHQTLRRAIEWSHELLNLSEKALLRRLAAFRGGSTLEAAEAVCRMEEDEDILAGLESLVEKNLVNQTLRGSEPWYVMLETIREFAEERLEESSEAQRIRQQHAQYYLEITEQAEPELDRSGGAQWVERLEQEFSNIRAAIAWSTEHAVEIGLRIAGAMERFCDTQGHWREEWEWLEKVLSRSRDLPITGLDRWRAKAFAALCCSKLSPWTAASSIAAGNESLALWHKVGDDRGLARTLQLMGLAHTYSARDPEAALAFLEKSASLYRAIDDRMGLAHTLFWLAYIAFVKAEYGKARHLAEEDLELARRAGDVIRVAGATGLLGQIAAEEGDFATAQSHAEKSLALYRETKDRIGLFHQLSSLGGIAILQGNYEHVHSYYHEAFGEIYADSGYSQVVEKMCYGFVSLRQGFLEQALSLFREAMAVARGQDSPWARQCIAACLAGIADVELKQGHARQAARILGGVESIIRAPYARLAWGHDLSITPTLMRVEFDRIIGEVRAAISDSAPAAFEEGRLLTLEQLVKIGLAASV